MKSNPLSKTFKIDKARTILRLKQGAQPTETVVNLLKKVNLLETNI